MRSLSRIGLFISALSLGACLSCDSNRLNAPPKAGGKLTVLTRYSPTIYYIGREGTAEGFEADLVRHFAEYMDADIEFEVADSLAEILLDVASGKADFAAAGVTRTPEREQQYLFGPDYLAVRQQLVCHRHGKKPKSRKDMVGLKISVPSETTYIDTLEDIKKDFPKLTWTVSDDESTEQILEKVWLKKIDCTIADSNIVKINRRYFPELSIAFSLTEKQPLSWVLPPSNKKLQKAMNKWFARLETQSTVRHLEEKYFEYVPIFDYVDVKKFKRRVKKRLSKYKKYFKKEAEKYGFAWTLLAAQAYQESHWNPKATSPTGVRGIMMLTNNTAESLGVENRLDPKQSIEGGAKYLQRMRKRIPEEIKEPSRTWFALAAYNVGFAHLRDARTLAKRLNKNPNVWSDVQSVLPLLSQKKFYQTLKYGYARGSEPVRYVRRIRNYEDMLLQTMGKR